MGRIEDTARSIEQFIRDVVKSNQAQGVLIGLSGGLDSTVLVTLAVRALGREAVHVVYLYDRDSGKESERRACLAAGWLGLELEVQNIEPAMRKQGVYDPFFMRVSCLSGWLNRLLMHSYELLFRESPWISILCGGQFEGHRFKQLAFNAGVRPVEIAFNVRHIYRRGILAKMAEDRNLVLLGAANRSEYAIGWFVKGGIDDLPYSPLAGLYKNQIQQLAAYLGVPSEIQHQKPSPDMFKGITDDAALGLSYEGIDFILDGMDRGLTEEEMLSAGVTRKEINHVRQMTQLSKWKRIQPS
jgi:NAD+ synthase